MGKITGAIGLFVFFQSLNGVSELERAVQYSCVPEIKQLVNAGVPLSPLACELAGKRDAVAHYFYLYLTDILDRYLQGEIVVGISRADVYTWLSALLLHVKDVHLARQLLLRGARIDYKDSAGKTALEYALADEQQVEKSRIFSHEREDVYEQLLSHVQQKTLTKDFLHEYFSGLNRLSINRPYVQLEWHTALIGAVLSDYQDGVDLLLKYGAIGINEALLIALHTSGKKVIQLLVGHGAKIHTISHALSLVVASNRHAHTIVSWLSPLVKRSERNRALIQACMKGDVELVNLLIRHGASVYYHDEHEVTPLYAAVLGHNLNVVKTIATHKGIKLTPEQREFARTFFPAAYEFLNPPKQQDYPAYNK